MCVCQELKSIMPVASLLRVAALVLYGYHITELVIFMPVTLVLRNSHWSATLIWWINKCRWCIMLLIMNEHQFLIFYEPTYGLPASGQNKISIIRIDSGKGSIKWKMELWWYPSRRQGKYQGYCPHMDWRHPKHISGVILSLHLSKGWYSAKGRASSYTGHKSGYKCLGLESNLDLLNICIGVDV